MTRGRGRLFGAGITAMFLAFGIAGCGTATRPADLPPGTPPAGVAATPTPTPASPRPGSTGQPGTDTPKQRVERAEGDAAAILAAFIAPPGARHLTTPPAASRGVPEQLAGFPLTPDFVDKVGWWQVAGDPRQVINWISVHEPNRFDLGGTGVPGWGSGPSWSDVLGLPPVPGVLVARNMAITTARAGSGQTIIRVDALVAWMPVRPPGETIPPGATAVTLSLNPSSGARQPAPVTVTSQAVVRKLIGLIDGLPLYPPGPISCANGDNSSLVLTFRAGPGGPVLAVATLNLETCEQVNLTIGGRPQPTLGPLAGGYSTALAAQRIAGLNWLAPLPLHT